MSNSKQVPEDHLAGALVGHKASQDLKDLTISSIKVKVEEASKVIHSGTYLKNSRNSSGQADNKEVLLEKPNKLRLKVKT